MKTSSSNEEAPSRGWGILTDIYYVYYLPSSSIRPETKRKFITLAAEQGGFSVPTDGDPVWDALQKGFSRTGQRYNLKYAQFWAVLIFANVIKRSSNRKEILGDPQKFQQTIDSALVPHQKSFVRQHDLSKIWYSSIKSIKDENHRQEQTLNKQLYSSNGLRTAFGPRLSTWV
jgi:hypothetical protein